MFDVRQQGGVFFFTVIHIVNIADDVLFVSLKIGPLLYIAGVKIVGIDDVGLAVFMLNVDADFIVFVGIHHPHLGIGHGLLQLLRQLFGEFALGQFALAVVLAK